MAAIAKTSPSVDISANCDAKNCDAKAVSPTVTTTNGEEVKVPVSEQNGVAKDVVDKAPEDNGESKDKEEDKENTKEAEKEVKNEENPEDGERKDAEKENVEDVAAAPKDGEENRSGKREVAEDVEQPTQKKQKN
eukprot:TRINITY_DN7212_c0_g1_i1.p1 TRINITY_DN7212_c0_g1~~TRINITY_DN7212_c0_g1_i1.p1  ORF type:complete len:135 (-),score=46.32 TRINITY_DN7212_c0_g1_i1:255-659(-)